MKIIVHELTGSGLEQVVVPGRHTIVEAIRPHLYRHNFATGSLKIRIYDSGSNLVAESAAVDIADIGTMDYFHGYVRFLINAYLAKDAEYTIKLVGTDGYSFDEAAYIGWVNGHDLGKYASTSTPASDYHEPFDLEIWERTVK